MWLSGLLRMCRWADTLRSWLSLHLSVIGGFLSLAFWKPTTVLEGWGALQWCAQPCVTVWEMAGPWTWWLTVGEATFCTWKVTKWGSVGMWQGCPKRRDGQRRNSLQSDAAFCLTFWPCLVEIGLTGSFIIIFFYFDQILFFFFWSLSVEFLNHRCVLFPVEDGLPTHSGSNSGCWDGRTNSGCGACVLCMCPRCYAGKENGFHSPVLWFEQEALDTPRVPALKRETQTQVQCRVTQHHSEFESCLGCLRVCLKSKTKTIWSYSCFFFFFFFDFFLFFCFCFIAEFWTPYGRWFSPPPLGLHHEATRNFTCRAILPALMWNLHIGRFVFSLELKAGITFPGL